MRSKKTVSSPLPENDKTSGAPSSIKRAFVIGLIACLCALAAVIATWTLARKTVRVRIETTPAGASVWIDEHYRGIAPCDIALSIGNHLLRCARHDCKTVVRSFTATRGQTATLRVSLQRKNSATLRIATTPPNATISIDGVDQGHAPLTIAGLQPGKHEIIAMAEACDPCVKTIDIKPGQNLSVRLAPQAKIESYYLKRIENTPRDLANYIELLHHYVLKGKFADAQKVFTEALIVVAMNWARPQDMMRFTQEIQKINNGMFEYQGREKMQKILESSITDVIAAYPRARWLYMQLQMICKSSGRLGSALPSFELGAKEMPWDPWVNGQLAWIYLQLGRLDDAEKIAKKTVRLSRASSVAHYVLGCVCRRKSENEKAREHFETALRYSRDWKLRKEITLKMRGL